MIISGFRQLDERIITLLKGCGKFSGRIFDFNAIVYLVLFRTFAVLVIFYKVNDAGANTGGGRIAKNISIVDI